MAVVSSLADVVARHVDSLVQLPADDVPEWLTQLGVPAGWRIGRLEGNGAAPSRIAVCGPQSHGGGYGCETISVFGFTGMPPVDVVRTNANCTLRDLYAEGITAHILATTPMPWVAAVRSSGYFSIGGLPVWAQYSSYIAGSDLPSQGRLIQQGIFIESSSLQRLSDDITQLSDAVHHAFLTAIGTRGETKRGGPNFGGVSV